MNDTTHLQIAGIFQRTDAFSCPDAAAFICTQRRRETLGTPIQWPKDWMLWHKAQS